jgi:hypothetical protein
VENKCKSFDKKKSVPEKHKLRFKDMRQGFAAHEKTRVLRGGKVDCRTPVNAFEEPNLLSLGSREEKHPHIKTKIKIRIFFSNNILNMPL